MRKDTPPDGGGEAQVLLPGERLRLWCVEHHGSMRRAAPELDMSVTMLSFLCNAKKKPSATSARRIEARTGIAALLWGAS